MENKIVAQKNTRPRVSMKKFLWFSFFMYPFWVIAILIHDELVEIVNSNSIANLIIFFTFAIINYLYGQINIKFYQVIIVCITTIIFIGLYAIDMHESYGEIESDYTLDVIQALMLYVMGFPVILFIQFFTWIPFLAKFIWQNRKNMNNLMWD